MNMTNAATFLITILITTNYSLAAQKAKEAKKGSPCMVTIWNKTDYAAGDNDPSIFPIVQQGESENATYRLPNLVVVRHGLAVLLESRETLKFICRKKYSFFELNIDLPYVIECHNGDSDQINFEKIKCTINAKPTFNIVENQSCGKGKNIYQIGYDVYPQFFRDEHYAKQYSHTKLKEHATYVYFPFVRICADTETKQVSYTMHTINGVQIAGRQQLSSIPETFEADGFQDIQFKTIYHPQTQYDTFLNKLEDKTDDYFDNEYSYFIPQQLVPDYDMMLKNWKSVTHFYVNTAPQWQIITCTWYTLEELIRERAIEIKAEVVIFTGTYGLLTLNQIKIYMPDSNIPVPRYFWKIAVATRDDGSHMTIGFVTSNNPYEDEEDEKETFCTNICLDTLWTIDVTTPGLGRTICCRTSELLEKLDIELEIETDEETKEMLNIRKIDEDFFMI